MTISSRTPEGDATRCPVCGAILTLEPSRPPGDAPCPSCGSLVWFPAPAVRAAGPNGALLLVGSDETIPLVRDHLTLGRRQSCDIWLRFANVSGVHCELVFTDGRWVIRDLKSTNGVKVNGKKVAKRVLQPGDKISIAQRHYTIQYTPATGTRSPG